MKLGKETWDKLQDFLQNHRCGGHLYYLINGFASGTLFTQIPNPHKIKLIKQRAESLFDDNLSLRLTRCSPTYKICYVVSSLLSDSNNIGAVDYVPFKVLDMKSLKIFLFKQEDLDISTTDVKTFKEFLEKIPETCYSSSKTDTILAVGQALLDNVDIPNI